MPPDRSDPPRTEAETLDNALRSRHDSGETIDWEELHRDHPDLAELLDRLRTEFAERDAQGPPRSPPSFEAFLEQLAAHSSRSTRYTLKRKLAQGGMGAILQVRDEDLRRDLAMKVILDKARPEGTDGNQTVDPVTLGRFLDEAQVTGMLDHPGIVPVHELGLDQDGRVYFTMRLVQGWNLHEVIRLARANKEGWNRTRALEALLKACDALAFAHKHAVVHRDIKPSNIMAGRFGEVYVMDWGIARVKGRDDFHDLRLRQDSGTSLKSLKTLRRDEEGTPDSPIITMDGQVIGTPAYMSPEQARGDVAHITARTDVYAMGVILHELLVGHTPFEIPGVKRSPRMILLAVQQEVPRPVTELAPDIPPELAAICEKAMAREATRRYADVKDLAKDLRAFLDNRIVEAYRVGPIVELKKWVVRNKPLATALAAVIVLLALGGGGFAWKSGELGAALGRERELGLELHRALADSQGQRDRAESERDNVLRLSAFRELDQLQREADRLWPMTPEMIPRFDAWLTRARALAASVDHGDGENAVGYREQLEQLRRRALPGGSDPPADRRLEFASAEDGWWHDQLASLIEAIDPFADPRTGLIEGTSEEHGPGVAQRRVLANDPRLARLTAPSSDRLWSEAIASIKDRQQCPAYDGLEITRQVGLLPIGRDPISGLWEFWHAPSGDHPERSRDESLMLSGSSGIVLILIPGGSFSMGARDSRAADAEGPVHRVTLSPYFISKYELTQGQWVRITGSNPSAYPLGDVHPVEQVSWHNARVVLPRLGLTLPSEAQWERAARGNTETPWWTGGDEQSLHGLENLWSGIDAHAPVDGHQANPFGLHDVHGNVWEWCVDVFDPHAYSSAGSTDPSNHEPTGGDRVIRGGGFNDPATLARSAYRYHDAPTTRDPSLGIRPARPIRP